MEVKPNIITFETFVKYMSFDIEPIKLNISNINIPENLLPQNVEKKDIIKSIRTLLNILTVDNMNQIKDSIRELIIGKISSIEKLTEIANELVLQFISSREHIGNYMNILNYIYNVKILKDENQKYSESIGNCFLKKCRELTLVYLEISKVESLADLDLTNNNDIDFFHKEKEKIISLIVVICHLYKQRNSNLIRVSAAQVIPLIRQIIDTYKKLQTEMNLLGDPYIVEECKDEERYFVLQRMCSLYAEYLYTFFDICLVEFNLDDSKINNQTLKSLYEEFRKDIIPTLSEPFLIENCKKFNH